MRILKRKLRGSEGEITLLTESLDDLWHLKFLVDKGDLVFALTHRRATGSLDKLRPEKLERKPVRLGVRVELVEFHIYSNWLRIHGTIESGVDIGSYHTLNIDVGTDLSIVKCWRPEELLRIDEAVSESNRPRVVIALVEEGEATVGVLRQFGVETVSEIRMSSGKGMGGDRRGEFLGECAGVLERAAEGDAQIILAGPGFAKEDLLRRIGSVNPELSKKITLADASSVGVSGFQEVLRRGAVDKIVEKSRLALDTRLIDDLFREIATDGKAAYGPADVERASSYGAIDTLLVLDILARDPDIEPLIKSVIASRGKLVVVSSEFEPGERLLALGGVAALLRFKSAW
jgi:protein pelota